MPFGAAPQGDGSFRFRLWAPGEARVVLEVGEAAAPLQRDDDGWHECTLPAAAGQRYRYRLADDAVVPDPASRFNPDDVHGASELVDPRAYEWRHPAWRGRPWHEAVIYELHVGCFTPAGTYAAAEAQLPVLAAIGITAVQLMPLADFPGRFGWGYDGVLPYAPHPTYGTPDDLKRFIQAAHRLNLMVFLDVVYNHFGPDGNYLHRYAPQFFTDRHKCCETGGPNCTSLPVVDCERQMLSPLADRISAYKPEPGVSKRVSRTAVGVTDSGPSGSAAAISATICASSSSRRLRSAASRNR